MVIRGIREKNETERMVRERYEDNVDAWLWEREEKEELMKKKKEKKCVIWKAKSYYNDITEDKKEHIKTIGTNLNTLCWG